MSKKILHFQILTDDISDRNIAIWESQLRKILPRYYIIIFSPFKITIDKESVTLDSSNVDESFKNKRIVDTVKQFIEAEKYKVTLIK